MQKPKKIDDTMQGRLLQMYFEMEDIAGEICDHYCKYPDTYDEDDQGAPMSEVICLNCPLGRCIS